MSEQNKNKSTLHDEEKPPFGSSWNQLYLLVFINLVGLIILFYLFGIYFS